MSSSPSITLEARRINARRSALLRHHPEDIAAIVAAESAYKFQVLHDRVRVAVESDPELTDGQRLAIAALLARPLDGGAA